MKYQGNNAFVAECKFWKGRKALLEGDSDSLGDLDQLLSYLTWRDSKSAMIYFVKQKEITSVIKTVVEAMPEQANFVREGQHPHESWLDYRLHLPGDVEREIHVAVLFFHFVPSEAKRNRRRSE
jgi:hypothetical protein